MGWLCRCPCRHTEGTYQENKPTRNSSGNTRTQSSQLGVRERWSPLIPSPFPLSPPSKRKKCRGWGEINLRVFPTVLARRKRPSPSPVWLQNLPFQKLPHDIWNRMENEKLAKSARVAWAFNFPIVSRPFPREETELERSVTHAARSVNYPSTTNIKVWCDHLLSVTNVEIIDSSRQRRDDDHEGTLYKHRQREREEEKKTPALLSINIEQRWSMREEYDDVS